MDNFQNKINTIKSTIDEIRGDIESMKFRNDESLHNLKKSVSSSKDSDNRLISHRLALRNQTKKENGNANTNVSSNSSFLPYERGFCGSQSNILHSFRNKVLDSTHLDEEIKDERVVSSHDINEAVKTLDFNIDLKPINLIPNTNVNVKENMDHINVNAIPLKEDNANANANVKPSYNLNLDYNRDYSYNNNNHLNNNNNQLNNNALSNHYNSNYNNDYSVQSKTDLENQIGELLTIVNELRRRNALLQTEVNRPNTNDINDINMKDFKSSAYSDNPLTRDNFDNTHNHNHNHNHNNDYNYDYAYYSNNNINNINNINNTNSNSYKPKRRVDYKEIVYEMISIMGSDIPPEDLPFKLREQLLNTKIKDEFMDKLWRTYSSLTGDEVKDTRDVIRETRDTLRNTRDLTRNTRDEDKVITNVDITAMWRWIKSLIHTKTETLTMTTSNSLFNKEGNKYKDFIEGIMREYNLKDINDLKIFFYKLMSKNMKNNLRVEKMKQLLVTEPDSVFITEDNI